MIRVPVILMALAGVALLSAQSSPVGWKVNPAGTVIPTDTFPGSMTASPDGKYVFVLNTGIHQPSISVIDIAQGRETGRTPVPDAWLGLAMNRAGDRLYVGGGAKASVYEFVISAGRLTAGRTFAVVAEKDRTSQDFVGDVQLSPDGRTLYAALVHRNQVVALNPQSGLILSRIRTGRRPYRILFHPSGKFFYVSAMADGSVGQYDATSGERLANFPIAPHPTDMVWVDGPTEFQPEIKGRLFLAAANTNNVYVFGASETGDLSKLRTINVALTQRMPLGTTPTALALSPDRKTLYAACSGINAVALIDVGGEISAVRGFIPTGWYPAAVTSLAGRIAVANGHSASVQLTDIPDETALNQLSDTVSANAYYEDTRLDRAEVTDASPIHEGGPIHHVIYIVRDGGGSGTTPNRDRLAKEFVTLSGYKSAADSLAEGANLLISAFATNYTVRLAPASAAGRRSAYDYEGPEPANVPPAGYLWTAAAQAGLKVRNYGFQVLNLAKPGPDGEQIDRVFDPALTDLTDMEYRGADPAYPDTSRAKEFAAEMSEFEQTGEMPQLLMVRIGSDDGALGLIADAVRKSRFWKELAMFVADATGDASPLVISPLAKQRAADTTAYDQFSIVRSVEMILGLNPMTIFDAAATPMSPAFAVPTAK